MINNSKRPNNNDVDFHDQGGIQEHKHHHSGGNDTGASDGTSAKTRSRPKLATKKSEIDVALLPVQKCLFSHMGM